MRFDRLLMVFVVLSGTGCASQALSLDDPGAFPMTVEPAFLYAGRQAEFEITANDLADVDDEPVRSGDVDLLGVTLNGQPLRITNHRFIKQFKLAVRFEIDSDFPIGFHEFVVDIRNQHGIFTLSRQVEVY